jgi:hypothetical protein
MAPGSDLQVRRPGRSAGERGYGLVELLVAVGLLLLGMALASTLFLRSQIASSRSIAEFRNPQPRYASARLRRDLESSLLESSWLPGWRSEPLILRTSSEGRIAWRAEGTTLLREQLNDDGGESVVQVVLREVESFSWRRPVPGLVDVEIRFRALDGSGEVLLDVPGSRRAKSVVRTESVRVASGRGPGW